MLLLRSLLLFDDSDHNSRNQEDCQGPEVDCNLEEPFCDDLDFVECVHVISYSGDHPLGLARPRQR